MTRASEPSEPGNLSVKSWLFMAEASYFGRTKAVPLTVPFSRVFPATGNTTGSISPRSAAKPAGKAPRSSESSAPDTCRHNSHWSHLSHESHASHLSFFNSFNNVTMQLCNFVTL